MVVIDGGLTGVEPALPSTAAAASCAEDGGASPDENREGVTSDMLSRSPTFSRPFSIPATTRATSALPVAAAAAVVVAVVTGLL